jgi:hypothetical protein
VDSDSAQPPKKSQATWIQIQHSRLKEPNLQRRRRQEELKCHAFCSRRSSATSVPSSWCRDISPFSVSAILRTCGLGALMYNNYYFCYQCVVQTQYVALSLLQRLGCCGRSILAAFLLSVCQPCLVHGSSFWGGGNSPLGSAANVGWGFS